MGRLSTHVLDTHAGRPAGGMRLDFFRREDGHPRLLRTVVTNADGRTDEPLLDARAMQRGEYELAFFVADYFRSRGVAISDPPFLGVVPLRFAIADPAAHYHVPLLCTPWSYSTYRGS